MSLSITDGPSVHAARRDQRLIGLRAILALLDDGDRRLAELTFVHNLSVRRAAGALNRMPGATARRVRWLRELLLSPATHAVAGVVDSLDPDDRRFAVDYFFRGASVHALAQRYALDRRAAQSRVDYFRGWARGLARVAERVALADALGDRAALDGPDDDDVDLD